MKNDILGQKIIDFLISGKEIEFLPREETGLLKKASQNRVLYEFSKRVQEIQGDKSRKIIVAIFKQGDIYLEKLNKTLLFIKENTSWPYLVVKTNRNHQYITYDIDLLVKDKTGALSMLERKTHPQEKIRKQVNLIRENLLTIDLHEGFYWQGSEYIDLNQVWTKTQKVVIQGVEVKTPSREAEITINLAHFLFERRYLTILDFWYFYDEFKKGFNKEFLFKQAKKYGWDDSLHLALSTLETVGREFIGEENLFFDKTLPRKKISFPFFLRLTEGLSIFKEKYSKRKEFPWYDLAYYFFAIFRYYLSGKRLFPYYREWFDFKKTK